ncbi:MAG: prephenate dehydrogenase/arogenate dehydrogenase family protein [Actinomycetota bacterium]|nr:prephenate dehydrogenase/arogenate dehydrogenase family protein [Actinomycetota bacterium]MDQ3720759.1 prephenate dehydrogenase/arogenate dehydrogenase family protein [Actinomycetota bacterium]
MRIAVLGVGLIGGSIGLAARAVGDEVVGFGRSSERLETARERGAIDLAARSLEDALHGVDACFCCGPVGALPAQVQAALDAAGEGCVVSDVGSAKAHVLGAIGDERFVGGHPVAGAETSGVENARADLFQGAAWYLTPSERSSGVLLERLHRLVRSFGARPIALDAATHDRLLATVSHLPHVLANVLVAQAARTLAQEDEPLPRAGPSFRDATRVAGANTDVWTDIYLANRRVLAAEIDETVGRLQAVAASLRNADADSLSAWNDSAREDRRRLLEANLTGEDIHELRLTVPNRPGIVAQVALALGRADVNIVDLALAPASDNLSGAMTLWIAGDARAARAAELIGDLGFPVHRL